jgi:hypothetical protein
LKELDAHKLTNVYVKKYHFSLLLPIALFPDAIKTLSATDGDVVVATDHVTSIHFYEDHRPLAKGYSNWATEHADAGDRVVQYKVLRDSWFVVSGTFGSNAEGAANKGFYVKGVKRGDTLIMMRLLYNENTSPIPEDALTAISHSFTGQ